MINEVTLVMGIVIGSICVLSAVHNHVRFQSFGLGGVVLTAFGTLLLGLSIWQSVELSIDAKGNFTAAYKQYKKNEGLKFNLDKGALSLEDYLGSPGPDGRFDPIKIQKIKACMKITGIPKYTLFIDLLLENIFAEKRVEILECVNNIR